MAGTVGNYVSRLLDLSIRFPQDVDFLSFRVYVLDTPSHSSRAISVPTFLW